MDLARVFSRLVVAALCVVALSACGGTSKDSGAPSEDAGSAPETCTPGPAPDVCNECTCVDGKRVCTDKICLPEPVCREGDTTKKDCNTCTCMNGQWGCTLLACPPSDDAGTAKGCGARLGNTCSDTEYCAYTPGQLCGAADASSTCKPRPRACDKIYAPVCGCDNKTYGNDCEAAAAGMGVLNAGVCN